MCRAAARMPWKTPNAVSTDESPAPPASGERPVTNRLSRADDVHVGNDRADVAGGVVPAAERLHSRPYARSRTSVLSVRGSPMMTALPPPRSRPAHAALVGHRPGQVQHVLQGVLFRRVRIEAGAAERRAERC